MLIIMWWHLTAEASPRGSHKSKEELRNAVRTIEPSDLYHAPHPPNPTHLLTPLMFPQLAKKLQGKAAASRHYSTKSTAPITSLYDILQAVYFYKPTFMYIL